MQTVTSYGNVAIHGGSSAAATITLQDSTFSQNVGIRTGRSNDVIAIDGCDFAAAAGLRTGGGNDLVRLDDKPVSQGNPPPSTFAGPVHVRLGRGNDALRIQTSLACVLGVSNFSGGAGHDIFYQVSLINDPLVTPCRMHGFESIWRVSE